MLTWWCWRLRCCSAGWPPFETTAQGWSCCRKKPLWSDSCSQVRWAMYLRGHHTFWDPSSHFCLTSQLATSSSWQHSRSEVMEIMTTEAKLCVVLSTVYQKHGFMHNAKVCSDWWWTGFKFLIWSHLNQLSPLVEWLGNDSLDGVRGRHVLRTLFNNRNLTMEDILRFVYKYFLYDRLSFALQQ